MTLFCHDHQYKPLLIELLTIIIKHCEPLRYVFILMHYNYGEVRLDGPLTALQDTYVVPGHGAGGRFRSRVMSDGKTNLLFVLRDYVVPAMRQYINISVAELQVQVMVDRSYKENVSIPTHWRMVAERIRLDVMKTESINEKNGEM